METVGDTVCLRPCQVIVTEALLCHALTGAVQCDLFLVLASGVVRLHLRIEIASHLIDFSFLDGLVDLLVHALLIGLGTNLAHFLLLKFVLPCIQEALKVCHY